MDRTDCDGIEDIFRNGTPVVIFGSGISSALSGIPMGWWSWLKAGISLLDDGDQAALANKLEDAVTADELVVVAEEVISRSREKGTYSHWMNSFLMDRAIVNEAMGRSLRIMSDTGCHMLTTNYDSLIESATGRTSLSYMDRDSTFGEMRKCQSDKVIHIHGMYRKDYDDIVATSTDYNKLISDEGAQFVQNLASTMALVFIGCGGTMDDVNIRRMVAFSHENLGLDVERYLLYAGDAPPDVPDFIRCVRYGDSYDDLPAFLERLAVLRMSSISEHSPIVRLVNTLMNKGANTNYEFYGSDIGFYGRSMEIGRLDDFVETDGAFRWWAITGQAGIGKSRLAYEYMGYLRGRFFSFFIDTDADVSKVGEFTPWTDTLVIYDYVLGAEERIASSVWSLVRMFRGTGYRLRIIFLERNNTALPGSWYWNLTDSMTSAERSDFVRYEYCPDASSGAHSFLNLQDLDPVSVSEMIGGILKSKGISNSKEVCDRLRDEYASKSEVLAFRPLFVRLYTESRIECGLDSDMTYYGVDRPVIDRIEREQRKWSDGLEGDTLLLRSLIRLVVRASVTGRLDLSDIPSGLYQDWKRLESHLKTMAVPGEQARGLRMCFLTEWGQSVQIVDGELVSNYPDVIKERMFSYYLGDDEDWVEICDELWTSECEAFIAFISRCMSDYPEEILFKSIVQRYGNDDKDTGSLRLRLAYTQNQTFNLLHNSDEGHIILREECHFWQTVRWNRTGNPEHNTLKMSGLYSCVDKLNDMGAYMEAFLLLCEMSEVPGGDVERKWAFDRVAEYTDENLPYNHGRGLVDLERTLLSRIRDPADRRRADLVFTRHRCVLAKISGDSRLSNNMMRRLKKLVDNENETETELVMRAYYDMMLDSITHGGPIDCYFEEADKWSGGPILPELSDRSMYYLYTMAGIMVATKLGINDDMNTDTITPLVLKEWAIIALDEIIPVMQYAGPLSEIPRSFFYHLQMYCVSNDEKAREILKDSEQLLHRYPFSEEVVANHLSTLCNFYCMHLGAKIPSNVAAESLNIALHCPDSQRVQLQYVRLISNSDVLNEERFRDNPVLKSAMERNNMVVVDAYWSEVLHQHGIDDTE